jgi:hypothetical protein
MRKGSAQQDSNDIPLRDVFKEALENYAPVPEWAFEYMVYTKVWSGKEIQAGDTVLYAFVDLEDGKNNLLMTVLDRELEEIEKTFKFTGEYHSHYVPILKKR